MESTPAHLDCDVLIIGAGSAGLAAYKAASDAGAFCIIVERGPLGTTAQRSGDIPTVLLQEAGNCCRQLSRAGLFGLSLANTAVDNSEVLNSLRQVRARSTTDVLSFIYKIPDTQRIMGTARFLDATRAAVDDDYVISFKTAVIAVGASPLIPFEVGRLGGVLTSKDFFELDRLPRSMAVFGSGMVGLSIGQALAALGVEVTVFGNGQIWQLTDDQVTAAARELLQQSFAFEVSSELTAVEKTPDGCGIYYFDESFHENYLQVERVLCADLVKPNLEKLNLKALDLGLNERGMLTVNERTMQTAQSHIFAAGDAADLGFSTAKARRQGSLAGLNAARFPYLLEEKPRVPLNMLFTSPGLAMVGKSLEQMKERARSGHHFVAAETRLNEGRSRLMHAEGGIVRLYCDEESHRPLGAEICAPGAEHLAHFLALVMEQELTVEELCAFDFYHPSLEEALGQVCQSARKALERTGNTYGRQKDHSAGFL